MSIVTHGTSRRAEPHCESSPSCHSSTNGFDGRGGGPRSQPSTAPRAPGRERRARRLRELPPFARGAQPLELLPPPQREVDLLGRQLQPRVVGGVGDEDVDGRAARRRRLVGFGGCDAGRTRRGRRRRRSAAPSPSTLRAAAAAVGAHAAARPSEPRARPAEERRRQLGASVADLPDEPPRSSSWNSRHVCSGLRSACRRAPAGKCHCPGSARAPGGRALTSARSPPRTGR